MKNLLTIAFLAIAAIAFGQDDKYVNAMTGALDQLDTTETAEEFMNLGNRFSRIADAEGDKWLPYYWTAFCYALVGFMEEDGAKIDETLDQAQAYLEKADSLEPSNSEIYVLQSWIYSGRIMVDPMNRGMVYGSQAGQAIEQAIAFDETNPRAYYLKGSSMFYTPEMYGGGKDKAEPLLEEALERYEAFEPETELHPNWGQEQAAQMLEQCSE